MVEGTIIRNSIVEQIDEDLFLMSVQFSDGPIKEYTAKSMGGLAAMNRRAFIHWDNHYGGVYKVKKAPKTMIPEIEKSPGDLINIQAIA